MRNNSFFLRLFIIGMILTCFTIIPIPGQKAKIEKKDGLTLIYNPKKPVKKAGSPSTLLLNPDLRIGDKIEDENYSFSRIGGVEVDKDEDIIVIDEKEVIFKIYDKNGKYLRTFGKRGQGPCEFQNAARVVLKGGKDIVVMDRGNNRFSYYSKEGECLKEIPLGKYSSTSRVKPDSKGYIYADTADFDTDKRIDKIIRFDPEFKILAVVAEAEVARKPSEFSLISEWFMFVVLENDHLVWGRNNKYEFTVLNPDGTPTKKIIKDYDPVKITKKMQAVLDKIQEQGVFWDSHWEKINISTRRALIKYDLVERIYFS